MFGWFKRREHTGRATGDTISPIAECDFERAESLRGSLSRDQIAEVVHTYQRLGDWPPKDIAVHLLQDCERSQVREVMRDALRSPTVESRAIAYCSLTGDPNQFSTFVRDGVVVPQLVDRAIAAKFGA